MELKLRSAEIKFMLDEVGFTCIEDIKVQLAQLSGSVDFEEAEIVPIRGEPLIRNISRIEALDGKVMVRRELARIEGLESMFIDERIDVEELLSLLKVLEKIRIAHMQNM